MNKEGGSLWSGVLLISGTCIGAGMLAVPVVTGVAGFGPSLAINAVCWLFMLMTGLLFLEATLWSEDGANLLTMCKRFLGPWGVCIGGASFLFLYWCLEVSYISGGSPLFMSLFGIQEGGYGQYVLFSGLTGGLVLWGTQVVDRVNWILMIGLFFSFILLMGVTSAEVDRTLLQFGDWNLVLFAAPVLFTSYGYHNVIPSVASYLKRDARTLRWAIILGSTLPFIVFSLWQWVIMGSIPLQELQAANQEGISISQKLQSVSGQPWVTTLSLFFGFFALITSMLGVSLSMVDFLADGLRVSRNGWSRVKLSAAVFLPPLIWAMIYPNIFIEAIGLAGGIGEAILNGLMPILMVWVGVYKERLTLQVVPFAGKGLLASMIAFTLLIMGIELFHLWGGW